MFFVDSHCHLMVSRFVAKKDEKQTEGEFKQQYSVDAIIDRAHAAGVEYMLAIGTELCDIDEIRKIADSYENIFRTVGIHPQEAQKHCKEYSNSEISAIIDAQCALPKTVAIGEIGLDYHFERESERQQKDLFHLQLEIAEKRELPVVIHSRDAADDTIAILQEHPKVCGVIHCFSGDENFAHKSLDLGYFISMSGIITFKNATELREVLKIVPLNRLLIETDAPFLAPVPHRGKINEPAFVVHVAETVARELQIDVAQVAETTSTNFFKLFEKARRISTTK